jgi:O-antigen/teichoic acid export membrane protein
MLRKLGKFAFWNVLTTIAIIIITLFSLPIYINNLAPSSFAILSLIWSTLSVSSILDLGLGRSIIRELSVLENLNDRVGQSVLISTGYRAAIILSTLAAIIGGSLLFLYFSSNQSSLTLSGTSIIYLSIIIFCTILNNVVLSIIEGVHLIRLASILKVIFTIAFFGAPAILFFFDFIGSLEQIILVILFSKLIQIFSSTYILRYRFAFSFNKISLDQMRDLFKLGRWLTLSNFVSLLMTHSDRFIIGYYMSPLNLVHYSVASDMVQRSSGLFSVLPNSLYPIISHSDKAMFNIQKIKVVFIFNFLLVTMVFIISYFFADFFLNIWLKQSYSIEISQLFILMSVGWFGSSFGQLFLTRLHSVGDTRSPSLLHLLESLFFIPSLILSLIYFGIFGGAIVVTLRSILDGIFLWRISMKYEKI